MQSNIKVVKVQNERGQTERGGYVSYQLCDLVLPTTKLTDPISGNGYFLEDGERLLSHSFFMDSMRRLMGKTLTIVDASISDREQKKAVKDLVRNMFSDEMEHEGRWAYDQDVISKIAEASIPEDPAEWETVTIEEALGVIENPPMSAEKQARLEKNRRLKEYKDRK